MWCCSRGYVHCMYVQYKYRTKQFIFMKQSTTLVRVICNIILSTLNLYIGNIRLLISLCLVWECGLISRECSFLQN